MYSGTLVPMEGLRSWRNCTRSIWIPARAATLQNRERVILQEEAARENERQPRETFHSFAALDPGGRGHAGILPVCIFHDRRAFSRQGRIALLDPARSRRR